MSQKQLVEKTHHLQTQLEKLKSDLNLTIQNKIAISKFYKKRLAHYREEMQYQVQDGSPYRPLLATA